MSDPRDDEADALFAVVRQRRGGRLTPEQLEEVRKIVAGMARLARSLRAVRLSNADAPAHSFAPYRGDERPPAAP